MYMCIINCMLYCYVYMYFVGPLVEMVDKCLTYIIIRITKIDEIFCGGAVNYSTTISPSDGQLVVINDTFHKFTGLTSNTSYTITTNALRRNSLIHHTEITESTLKSLSMYFMYIITS